jgi:hypothetical protein
MWASAFVHELVETGIAARTTDGSVTPSEIKILKAIRSGRVVRNDAGGAIASGHTERG